MKFKRLISTVLGMAAVTVVVMAVNISKAEARYPYNDMSLTECTVRSNMWDWGERDRNMLPLPIALYYANGDGGSSRIACTEIINLEPAGDTIFVLRPIEIRRGGGSDDPSTPEEELFLIQGNPHSGSKIVLDAQFFDRGPGDAECLITVDGSNVKLKNIEIINVPRGMDALCLNQYGTVLDNVAVSSISSIAQVGSGDSNAIVFSEESTNSIIMANSAVHGVDGYGVVFNATSGSLSNAILWPAGILSGGTMTRWVPAVTDTDEFGLAKPPAGAVKFDISLSRVERFFKNDNSKLRFVSKKMQVLNNPPGVTPGDYIWLQGWIVKDEGGDICQARSVNDAVRVQIYNKNGFYGYINTWNSRTNMGLGNLSSLSGVVSALFEVGDPETELIMLMPEAAGGQVGKPQMLTVSGEANGECPDRPLFCNPGDPGCTPDMSDPTTPGGFTGVSNGFGSVKDCQAHGALWSTEGHRAPAYGYDTDGDYLFDDDEDFNLNCICETELGETCWDHPDTDRDGIPDGAKDEAVCKDMNDDGTYKVVACSDSAAENRAIADFDNDGKASALDKDSDGDGLYDYQEDRTGYYTNILETLRSHTKGLLYTYGKGIRDDHPLRYNGEVVECDLGTGFIGIGVRYDWWIVTYGSDGVTITAPPVMLGDRIPEDPPEGSSSKLEILRCRHQALSSPANFNGQLDEDNIETGIINLDSDNDDWCDGPGANCGSERHTDACPTVQDPSNECRVLPCSTTMLLYGVHPDYVHVNDEKVPDYLLMDNSGRYVKAFVEVDEEGNAIVEGGQPKWRSWEEISLQICFGDLDNDGIPNCVEAPNSNCDSSGTVVDSQTKLSPNKKDTDGDGLIDGWHVGAGEESDVCPTVSGPGGIDRFMEGKTSYSCDPRNVYDVVKIISCFLDRDADGVRDCEEDKNMDGDYNNQIRGLDGIGKTESNSLARDSDSDNVSDYLEIKGWPMATNPAYIDTDEDGLNDDAEDRDRMAGEEYNINFATAEGLDGCPNAMKHDTLPDNPDSDGDGLDDRIEITGEEILGQDFINLLTQLDAFSSGGIDVYSDPASPDSDNDGLADAEEYSGVITYNDSHPCMADSDGDSVTDDEDYCPLNAMYADEENCGIGGVGADQDRDGLPDLIERRLGTDPRNPDTDNDGLKDGEEDTNANGILDVDEHESDPSNPDTDGDMLNDGLEVRYGTDPTNDDSDGDCISDGLEDDNLNGDYNAGAETNALASDTDGDGLADGHIGGVGEDLNCNGIRDTDASGNWTETDPRLADSDFDGIPDYDEMTSGGYFNISNVGRASTGREGCMVAAGTGMAPTSMMYLFGLLLIANRIIARRTKKGGRS
jgi:hypothetical protein